MEETTITIKKQNLWKYSAFILIAVIMIGGFTFFSSGTTQKTGDVVNAGVSGDVQKITLSMKNRNYYPNTITVKSGIPVSITLDDSIVGCLRGLNIRDLEVRGYSKNPSQTIDFTPTQKGTFRFACPMGMGYGSIVVE